MKNIAVIGAGPSGLMSIYSLLEDNSDLNITLIESENEIGKRIKVSGNGKCNFFHLPMDYQKYSNPLYAKKYMQPFMKKYKEIFNNLGIVFYSDDEGRCYPISNSSKTINHLFECFLKKNNVNILLNKTVKRFAEKNGKVSIWFDDRENIFDAVVLALGGFSYKYNFEEKNNFYKYNNIFITKLAPALTPIKTSNYKNKALVGKQFDVELTLTCKDDFLFKEKGRILFKKDGISGIVSLNLSSYLSRKHINNYDDYLIHIDFLPCYNKSELFNIIYDEKFTLYDNLSRLFIKELCDEFLMQKSDDIVSLIKNYKLSVKDLYSFDNSQVTSGGVDLKTLSNNGSFINSPLIFPCGEMLDIDGLCGGYNIAFCFASGYFVGKEVLKTIQKHQ